MLHKQSALYMKRARLEESGFHLVREAHTSRLTSLCDALRGRRSVGSNGGISRWLMSMFKENVVKVLVSLNGKNGEQAHEVAPFEDFVLSIVESGYALGEFVLKKKD